MLQYVGSSNYGNLVYNTDTHEIKLYKNDEFLQIVKNVKFISDTASIFRDGLITGTASLNGIEKYVREDTELDFRMDTTTGMGTIYTFEDNRLLSVRLPVLRSYDGCVADWLYRNFDDVHGIVKDDTYFIWYNNMVYVYSLDSLMITCLGYYNNELSICVASGGTARIIEFSGFTGETTSKSEFYRSLLL